MFEKVWLEFTKNSLNLNAKINFMQNGLEWWKFQP